MLLPAFINNDQITGFGFPFEWAFGPLSKNWLIGKGGDFPGYTSGMLAVPKMGFGCVAMANNIIGAELCYLVADLFLTYLEPALDELAPPLKTPSNLTLFEGLYTSVIPGYPYFEATINVTASYGEDAKSGVLFLIDTLAGTSATPEVLTWLNGNTFAYAANFSLICELVEMETFFEHVVFQTDPNEPTRVVSFTIPGTEPYYGIHWYKNN